MWASSFWQSSLWASSFWQGLTGGAVQSVNPLLFYATLDGDKNRCVSVGGPVLKGCCITDETFALVTLNGD